MGGNNGAALFVAENRSPALKKPQIPSVIQAIGHLIASPPNIL
jgi:hypothetical protein